MNVGRHRFVLGIFAGLLLGLAVVVSTVVSSGFASNLPGLATFAPSENAAASQGATTAAQASILSIYSLPISRLDSMAQQPIVLTAFAVLPVLGGLLLGLVVYAASRSKMDSEESSPSPS